MYKSKEYINGNNKARKEEQKGGRKSEGVY